MREQCLEDEGAARLWIIQSSPAYARKHKVQQSWKHAKEFVDHNMEGLTSKKEKRAATFIGMRQLLEPMADVLVRKYKHMELIEKTHAGYLVIMEELKTVKDPAEIERIMKELDGFHKREALLGFASKGEDHWKYQMASTYSDEYISCNGNHCRVYFICLAGKGGWADNKCLAILPSKVWQPKSGDWLYPKGWSCIACTSGYCHNWGVIIEIKSPVLEEILYVKSEVPDEHINDARAMFHEQEIAPVSPQDLYDKVPKAYPSLTELVQPMPGVDEAFEFCDIETFRKLPDWGWYPIFHFVGATLPAKPPTKKEAKAARWAAWESEQAAKRAGPSSSSCK